MYRVRTYNRIAAKGVEWLVAQGFEVGPAVDDPHALLLRSHRLAAEDLSPNVSAVARAGVGVNNVPEAECTRRGVVVFNTPGANANSVKELVLAAVLLSSRDVLGGLDYVRSLHNVAEEAELRQQVEAEKWRFKGHEVAQRTLGIVGLGAIGSRVARAALHLGMDVVGYDPALSVEAAWRLPSDVLRMENLPALLARSDYVTLHIPALAENTRLLDARMLALCRPGVVLLNFARQEIVDEEAVKDALETKRLRGYFSDFPSTTLAGVAGVHATPHLGASTADAEENCAVMAAHQLDAFLRRGTVRNSVNFPTVALEPAGGHRIGVTNRNVAVMLGQLMAVFADANINVIDMINKSQGDVAYNLVDLDTPLDEASLQRIRAINEVLGVRVFDMAEAAAMPETSATRRGSPAR